MRIAADKQRLGLSNQQLGFAGKANPTCQLPAKAGMRKAVDHGQQLRDVLGQRPDVAALPAHGAVRPVHRRRALGAGIHCNFRVARKIICTCCMNYGNAQKGKEKVSQQTQAIHADLMRKRLKGSKDTCFP